PRPGAGNCRPGWSNTWPPRGSTWRRGGPRRPSRRGRARSGTCRACPCPGGTPSPGSSPTRPSRAPGGRCSNPSPTPPPPSRGWSGCWRGTACWTRPGGGKRCRRTRCWCIGPAGRMTPCRITVRRRLETGMPPPGWKAGGAWTHGTNSTPPALTGQRWRGCKWPPAAGRRARLTAAGVAPEAPRPADDHHLAGAAWRRLRAMDMLLGGDAAGALAAFPGADTPALPRAWALEGALLAAACSRWSTSLQYYRRALGAEGFSGLPPGGLHRFVFLAAVLEASGEPEAADLVAWVTALRLPARPPRALFPDAAAYRAWAAAVRRRPGPGARR